MIKRPASDTLVVMRGDVCGVTSTEEAVVIRVVLAVGKRLRARCI